MQENTKKIIREDNDGLRAYEDAFGVPMPKAKANGGVEGLPAPAEMHVNDRADIGAVVACDQGV